MITGTWVEGEKYSDAWTRLHKIHFIERKATWRKKHGLGTRLTRNETTSRPDKVWPDMWKHMSDAAERRKQSKNGLSRNQKPNIARQ